MPKWSRYLEDEFEDEYEKFEKFKPRQKNRLDDDDKNVKKKPPVNDKK